MWANLCFLLINSCKNIFIEFIQVLIHISKNIKLFFAKIYYVLLNLKICAPNRLPGTKNEGRRC